MARNIPFRIVGRCIDCGGKIAPYRHNETLRCETCHEQVLRLRNFARVAVKRAIDEGALPAPADAFCVDCASPAHDYDHRDYREPLKVVPVCRLCNQRRGPAVWRSYCARAA